MKHLIFTLSMLFFISVYAQTEKTSSVQIPTTTTSNSVNNDQPKTVERIEVIGSRVKRIKKEGSTSVSQVKKDTIKVSANTTTAEALRDSAASMTGTQQLAYTAVSTIALRGIGAERTLVLLNGHRLPTDPSYDAVDINWIPTAAIEKIEILKDGASALYGSDAIGGVVNIITKKNFSGSAADLKLSGTEKQGGSTYSMSAVTGLEVDQHDLNVAVGYSHSDKILGRNREITKNGLSATGPAAAWRGVGQPKYTVPQVNDCPPSQIRTIGGAQRCTFKFNEIATTRPHVNQFNMMTDYTFRLGSELKFYNRNLALYRETEWSYAPWPYNTDVKKPYTTGIPSDPNVRSISFRAMELGNRDNRDSEIDFSSVLGFKGNFTPSLEYDFSASYGEINQKKRGYGGYVNDQKITDLIVSGAYNPLAPIGARGDLSPAVTNYFGDLNEKLFTVDLVTSGDLFELNGDTVGFAAGTSFMSDKQVQDYSDTGDGETHDIGQREVYSAFSEIVVPLTSKIETDLAARVDKYSDFGTTVNPKLSMKYVINEEVLVRASAGTGFKAPLFSKLYGKSSSGETYFIDRKYCADHPSDPCEEIAAPYTLSSNPDLKEENSISYSLGTVIQPASNLSFSIDGWYTKVKNIATNADLEQVTKAELNGTNTADYGVSITRDPGTGEITRIDYKYSNLAANDVAGADFNLEYNITNYLSDLGFQTVISNDFSYMFFDKDEGFPGAGTRNVMGAWGKPYWKNKATLTLKNDSNSLDLVLRSIPGQNVQDEELDRKISDMNEWDINYSHKFSSKQELGLGIKNIIDAEQPADIGGGLGGADEVNESLYDINGRRFFMTYSQKF